MALCIQMRADSTMCTNKATTKAGYCKHCDPNNKKKIEREQAMKAAAANEKREQMREIEKTALKNHILECKTLEDLRKLSLKVLAEFATNTDEDGIDVRIGSPIVQLLKFQEVLLTKQAANQKEEGLDTEDKREAAIKRASEMSPEDQLKLLGDFTVGMTNLIKVIKSEAVEVPAIDIEARNN